MGWGLPQASLPVTRVKGRCGRVKIAGRRTRLTCWSHFPSAEVIMARRQHKATGPRFQKDRHSKRDVLWATAIDGGFNGINLRLGILRGGVRIFG